MNKKREIQLIWVILLLAVFPATAQKLANFNASFVDIGFGARPLAMGQAFTAIANDVNAIIWNPAGIANVNKFEATFSFARQFGIVPYSYAGFVYSPTKTIATGLGTIISGDDLLNETTLVVAFAYRIMVNQYKTNIGINLSFHNANFGGNADPETSVQGDVSGISIHAGIQMFLSSKVIIATKISNLVNSISWNTSTKGKYTEGLPVGWTIGVGYLVSEELVFDLDYKKSLYSDLEDQFAIGLEKKLFNRGFIRGGTATSIDQPERLYYSFGAGITQNYQDKLYTFVDFAYIVHPLNDMFRISLSFQID